MATAAAAWKDTLDFADDLTVVAWIMAPDTMKTEECARAVADHIEAFWKELGYPRIRCHLERALEPRREFLWCVRSNMFNGLPPH